MRAAKFLKCEPCSTSGNTGRGKITAVSQILEVNGEQAIEISLFHKGVLKGRYFANEDGYNAWINGTWRICKLNNAARVCMGKEPVKSYYCDLDDCIAWESIEDKQRALDFLDTWRIGAYEDEINEANRQKAMERKVDRINDMMAEIPCVPDKIEEWLDQKIFPGHILFVKKEKKRTTYSCTACGCSSWRKKGWKHGEKTTCPKCGRPVTANSRQQEKVRKAPVILLQQYGEKWVERQFKTICRWSAGKKEIQMFEEIRAIIPKGKDWGKVWYGTRIEADEFEQDFWDRNQQNKRFVPSYLYPDNLQEVLPCGNLERSGIDALANSGTKFNVNKFITSFRARPYFEYIAKAGLYRLIADIVDQYGWWGEPSCMCTHEKKLKDALQLDGNRTNRMKQIDGNLYTLNWLQYEQMKGIKISQEALQYLTDKKMSVGECKDILKELKSVNRMVNYMKKQKISPKNLTTTWTDYLAMAKAEGYDTEDDIVRLPKDLKARHDELFELRNQRANKKRLEGYTKLDRQIQERLPEVQKYFWEDKTHMIIPAGNCEELMTEGQTLHHCVGSSDQYMKKMAAGETWILFLRKKEDLEKAYYTVEINMKDDRIIQYYSAFDRQPDKETISEVLKRFKQSIKAKRVRITVPVTNIA